MFVLAKLNSLIRSFAHLCCWVVACMTLLLRVSYLNRVYCQLVDTNLSVIVYVFGIVICDEDGITHVALLVYFCVKKC